jgi:DNA-binding Lrp family transcriptional regulator
MRRELMPLDVEMLRALWELGPRNLSRVARTLGINRRTLVSRIERMKSDPHFFLRIHTSVYHTNIGLRKAVVFLEANPGMEQFLYDCLLINKFWLYVCRSYGMGEGCTAVYAVPVENCSELEEFLHSLTSLGVARTFDVYWSTCFQGGRMTRDGFDDNLKKWVFSWDDWVVEVQKQGTDLPYTLVEAKSYFNYADEIDIRMLEKLEEDATRSLTEIARSLGISRQLARFHYKEHLVGKNLVEGYEVFVMRYGSAPSIMVYFTITFHSHETFAKFTRSLLNKFFVLTMGKNLQEHRLIVEVFLPPEEFRKFVEVLSKMVRLKLVKEYKYAIQDLGIRCRQTVSPPLFIGKSWVYDHKSQMTALQQKISDFSQQSLKRLESGS